MNTVLMRIIGAGLFFLAIFLSGFWLSRTGKPYHSLIFNLHKFIVLAAVVFLALTVSRLNQSARLNAAELTLCIVVALLFLTAIISGGLASLPQSMPAFLTTLHHVLPYLTILATAVALYVLLIRT